ncbi:MAG: hypothetical protein V1777_05615 [Candidatus Micrarchaeota archaeon]
MITEFVRAFFSVVKKPGLLVVALTAVLANLALVLLLTDPLASLLSGVVSGEFQNTGTDFFSLPLLLGNFGFEILAALVLMLGSLVFNCWFGMVLGRFAYLQEKKEDSVARSVRYGFQNWKKIAAWSLVGLLFAVFLGALFLIVAGISNWNGIIGLLFFLVWLAIGIGLGILLVLSVPIMGVENATVKEAFKKTAELAKTHFWQLVGFLVLVFVFAAVINAVGNALADTIEDENVQLVVIALFWMIQLLIVNLGLPFFYLNHRSKIAELAKLK